MKIKKRKARKSLWLIKKIRMDESAAMFHQLEMIFSQLGITAAESAERLAKLSRVAMNKMEIAAVKQSKNITKCHMNIFK